MKWESLERTAGQLTTQGAMPMFNFAVQHNMTVRGHTLVWHAQVSFLPLSPIACNRLPIIHAQLPPSIKNIKDKAQLTARMQGHITRAMGPTSPFHGKIAHWVYNQLNKTFSHTYGL
jgi:endo-1,4-beta-xylanase